MSDWDGHERRKNMSRVEGMLEDHITLDDKRQVEIIERIHRLDTSINSLTILLTETLKSQMSLVANNHSMTLKHNEYLYGEKGVSIRVDRLEGAEESRKWTFRVMWAAIISLLTKVFYDLIKR